MRKIITLAEKKLGLVTEMGGACQQYVVVFLGPPHVYAGKDLNQNSQATKADWVV